MSDLRLATERNDQAGGREAAIAPSSGHESADSHIPTQATTRVPALDTDHASPNGHGDGELQEADPLATLPVDQPFDQLQGRYRVLRPHAQGGLGRVLVAKDTELQREVALKEIRPDYAHDLDCQARFMREAEITGRLEHPGIVPVYSLGKQLDGSPYYAMRFVRGKSLHDAIKKFHSIKTSKVGGKEATEKNLELRRLIQRLIDVCQTMDYAHSRGVLHRDIKPGNIMLGAYGETLVVDWGLAKAIGEKLSPATTDGGSPEMSCLPEPSIMALAESDSAPTRLGAAVGTVSFMSPEQAYGRHDILGPESDVFSLGATLYQILTGVPPYRGQNLLRQAQQVEFVPPKALNRSVPRALDAICLKAMAPKPSDRYTSAGQMAQELERYLADEPLLARPDRGLDHLLRLARRHRAWAQAGALALGLIAIVASVAAVSIHGSLRRAERAEASAVDNLHVAEEARRQEAARAEAEALQRQRAEAAEESARASAARATTERDRAEREKRIVELIVAEHAPGLLRMPGEYFADRESLGEFAAALVTARQADATAEDRNRESLATFARLLGTKKVFRDDGPTNLAFDRYLFEKVILPALSVPPPSSLTADDRRHLALLWAAKGRLMERNPVSSFLAAAGLQLDEGADEFVEAMQVAHAAYQRSHELNPDAISAAGSLRTSGKLPLRLLDWPRIEQELSELEKHSAATPEKLLQAARLAQARKRVWQARHAVSLAEESKLLREAIDRIAELESMTRSADPYALRSVALLTASEASLAASRLIEVQSSQEGAAPGGGQTKFALLSQAMESAVAAQREGPVWCRQAARLARANILEELAYHYKELSHYEEARAIYEECTAQAIEQEQALIESNLARCELRWALDGWRTTRNTDARAKHLRSAYANLTSALGRSSVEAWDALSAAEIHSWLGILLFEAACEGPARLDTVQPQSNIAYKSITELIKTLPESARDGQLRSEILERLKQIELARQSSRTAAEMSRKSSSRRWVQYAQQAAEYGRKIVELQAVAAAENAMRPKSELVSQIRAEINDTLSVVAASPSDFSTAQRRQLIDLANALQNLYAVVPAKKSAPISYEKLFPENHDDAFFQRVFLQLSDAENSRTALTQAEGIIRQIQAPAMANLARGHCEKFKGDILYRPISDRIRSYLKSPDKTDTLSLKDDSKLRAIQQQYAAALRLFNSASDANTNDNLSLICSMKLRDMENRRWPKVFSPLEAEWLRRVIEDSESLRTDLFQLMTARIYLHGKDWDLKESKTPLPDEALSTAQQIVECLKPIQFLELYFTENKLDDYQQQLLQICESRCGSL